MRCVRLLLFLIVLATRATAGPNAGGTLIVHVLPPIDGCKCGELLRLACDVTDPCVDLDGCADARSRIDGDQNQVWVVIAAFPEGSSPRLSKVAFGIEYPPAVAFLAESSCADTELTTDGWPSSGQGTAISWREPRKGSMQVLYWFAGYNEYSPQAALFQLTPHPTQGGNFGDDSVPIQLDPIAGYGALGFEQAGVLVCPSPPSSPAPAASNARIEAVGY